MPASPMRYEAFLRSLSRPNHATGWFHPATPLPNAEVSFLTGEVIHQAGMAEMGGFEPPFAVCAPVSLTHGCSCRELQNAITTLPHLHDGRGARLSEPPDLFRASLLPADHRRNYNIEA